MHEDNLLWPRIEVTTIILLLLLLVFINSRVDLYVSHVPDIKRFEEAKKY